MMDLLRKRILEESQELMKVEILYGKKEKDWLDLYSGNNTNPYIAIRKKITHDDDFPGDLLVGDFILFTVKRIDYCKK